jgi:RND family efflux transporter MFP subunit
MEVCMKERWVAFLLLAVILLAGGGYAYYRFVYASSPTASEPTLRTTQVRRGDIVLSVSGTGNLLPGREVSLGFRTGGTLMALEVQVGDHVRAGQVLARLDTRELELQVAQARAALEQKEASLEQLLAGASAEEVATARNNLLQAQASLAQQEVSLSVSTERARLSWIQAANNLRDAQAKYENIYWQNRNLEARIGKENVPDANYDSEAEAWRAVENAEMAMEQARLAYEQAKKQQETSLQTARLQVANAQTSLEALLKGADKAEVAAAQVAVEQARLAYEQAQVELEKATLVAPFDGTVMAVNAQVGDQVGTGTILTLADLDAPLVRFWVEEADLGSIAVGNPVHIVFEALPDLTFEGRLLRIDPALVTVDGTPAVQCWASIDLSQRPAVLLSGMAVEVEVISAEARNVLLVPLEALRELGEGRYAVFVVQPDGELELRPVEVGLRDLVNAEIRSGLSEGEVVSLGTAQTSSAATVTPATMPFVPGGGPFFPGGGRP